MTMTRPTNVGDRPRLQGRMLSLVLVAGALLAASAGPAAGAVIRVESGGSIAEALERAKPGDVVEVEPGVYREALTVDTPNLTLRGIVRGDERPVLDGGGELADGVIASGSPFRMSGFRIQHYQGNGVTTQGVEGVHLTDLVVDDTGLYGVYPVNSSDITVTHCTVTRIRDAGIYVGESNRALVAYNEVHDNVAGIEIENTNDAEVRDNLARQNTTGILVFVLPLKMQKEGRRTRVHRNWVTSNNTPNFGDPESIVGQLPHGGGILVMGADETVVENNWVKDNDSFGIAVIRLPQEQAARDPELEPHSDGTVVRNNYLLANGTDPHPAVARDFGGGADLAWDGTGENNCIDVPEGKVHRGPPAPTCPGQGPAGRDEPPASPAASAGEPGEATDEDGSRAPDADHVVRIQGMRYHPKHLSIEVGDTVAWVNEDAVAHTVTSSRGTEILREPLNSSFLLREDRYRHTFDVAGRFEYLCLPHMDQAPMRGATVTVE